MPQQPGLRASRAGLGDTHRAAPEPRQTGKQDQSKGLARGWTGQEMECGVSHFRSPGTSCSPDN